MLRKNKGFTLVELLVALAVGSLVIVGAGQLFVVTLNTYSKVEDISRKQEAVVFAAHVLVNSYRRGEERYDMQLGGKGCEILDTDNDDAVVIDGLLEDDSGCDYFPPEPDNGHFEVKLIFPASNGNSETLVFNVMDRQTAINPD